MQLTSSHMHTTNVHYQCTAVLVYICNTTKNAMRFTPNRLCLMHGTFIVVENEIETHMHTSLKSEALSTPSRLPDGVPRRRQAVAHAARASRAAARPTCTRAPQPPSRAAPLHSRTRASARRRPSARALWRSTC